MLFKRDGKTASVIWRRLQVGAIIGSVGLLVGGFVSAAVAGDASFNGPTQQAKPPKGIKLAVVSCAAALKGCALQAAGAAEAAKAIGWDVIVLDGKANPKAQETAMLDALTWGANAIIAGSIDYRSIQLPLAEAKKASVPVVAIAQSGDEPNPLPKLEPGQIGWTFAVDVDNRAVGHAIADWIIKDSGGKANVVVFSDQEFVGVAEQHEGIIEGLAKCRGCVVAAQSFAASQVATNVGPQVVGFLRAHPNVNYVYAPYDPAAFAMVAAIRQAGMGNRVKLGSILGEEEDLDLIRRGDIQAFDVALDQGYSGYAAVDQLIRYLNKQPLFRPHGENLPYLILDKTNVPESGRWKAPNDFKAHYQELWK